MRQNSRRDKAFAECYVFNATFWQKGYLTHNFKGENGICQNWNLSESVFCRFLKKLEFVRIGICQNWNLSELEFVIIGNCQNQNLSELEFVRIGICQNWNLSELEFVRIGNSNRPFKVVLSMLQSWLPKYD